MYQIRAINAARTLVHKGATVTLNWVPGHTDIVGNELVDKLAKRATQETASSLETSFGVLECKAKELARWEQELAVKAYFDKATKSTSYRAIYSPIVQSKIRLPANTKRVIASSFFQLKLGHGYIKSYLNRLDFTASSNCPSCNRPETTAHLLLDCKELAPARARLKARLNTPRLSLPLLLHTKIGIEATLPGLLIRNRGWL